MAQFPVRAGFAVKIAAFGDVESQGSSQGFQTLAGTGFSCGVPGFQTVKPTVLQAPHKVREAAPGDVEGHGMGQDRDSPGFLDKRHGPVKFQRHFGDEQGLSPAQIPGKCLFMVFHQAPADEEGGKMGPAYGTAPGKGAEFLIVRVYAQGAKAGQDFPVPRFPEAGKGVHGGKESGTGPG
jgi:hypothetical protein